jgi:cysteine-rich repeat protein
MELMRFCARRSHLPLLLLTPLVVSSCAAPESPEPPLGQEVAPRTVAERKRLAAVRPALAPRVIPVADVSPADGQARVDALDIPPGFRPTFVSLVTPDLDTAAVVRTSYGVIRPTHHDALGHDSFLLLSTGASGNEGIHAEIGTDFPPLDSPDGDATTLTFQVSVPPGLNRMSFDYTFLSAESPEFVGSVFNDTFTATVSDAIGADRVIASASVNSSEFHPASDTSVGPCPFQLYVDDPIGVNDSFNQPGFAQVDAGTTGFLHADVEVASGLVTVTFDIRDLGDGILDSAVIIDNVRFSVLETLDPQKPDDAPHGLVDPTAGEVIHTSSPDPAARSQLATGGTPVHGAAADGVTQVVLRASVGGPGTGSFAVTSGAASDGVLSNDDGTAVWGPTATTHAVQIDDQWFVFALYRAPDDFNRGGDTTIAQRTAPISVDFAPTAGAAIHQDTTIDLVRPPVVVVPDIWANCASWSDRDGLLVSHPTDPSLQQFAVSCVDYQTTSSKSFTNDDNQHAVGDAIGRALQKLRDVGVAATRADVVGHGMGALLARRYIDAASYAGFDNFNAGRINRLITVSAPHLGSRLADEMIRTRNAIQAADAQSLTPSWPSIREALAGPGVHFDHALEDDALQQMGSHSPLITTVGLAPARPTEVFYHAMVSTGGHLLTRAGMLAALNAGIAGAMKNFFLVMENNHPSVVGGTSTAKHNLIFGLTTAATSLIFCSGDKADEHDMFATAPEQAGGLGAAFTTSFAGSPMAPLTGHYNMPNDAAHTTALVGLLNTPVRGGRFSTTIPSPGTLPSTNDCPIDPPVPPLPLLAAAPRAQVEHAISITTPVGGTTVLPGASVTVTVEPSGPTPDSVLIISDGSSELVEAPPFTASVVIPNDAIGATLLRAIAFYDDGGMAFAAPVPLTVQVNATVTSIEVVNGDQVLRRPGRTQRLIVLGTYSDGIRRDISAAILGTKYTISQLTPIISVSTAGVITALAPGNATIAITNGPATTSVNVKVGAAACGDGVLDPGEACDDGNVLGGDHCDAQCRIENLPPLAICTSPTQCNDPGTCAANVGNLAPDSVDPEGAALTFTQSPAGPYSVGQHAVTVDVSDGQHDAQCTSQVDVLDCEKPTVSCPASFTAECTSPAGAVITPPPAVATDNCSATVSAPDAAQRPLGTTGLTYVASDPSGNASSCTTQVTVRDTTPPAITCPPPIVAECALFGRAFVIPGTATSSDVCGATTVTGPRAGLFPLGTTPVNYASTDAAGNQASCSSTISVVDTRPPLAIAQRSLALWPADHQYRTVNLADCGIAVEDGCGGRLDPSVYQAKITCVTSDEPDDARGSGDGSTSHDIVLVDADTVKLRAERDAGRDGRAYKIHFQVRDASGNRGDGVCSVNVPRDHDCAEHPDHRGCELDDDRVANSVCAPGAAH